MKQILSEEFKRMQQLAGIIKESKYQKSVINENYTSDEVMDILSRNGIDDDYFESMGGKEIETGTEEWMDVLTDITGKDAYKSDFDEQDEMKIENFIKALANAGIELI